MIGDSILISSPPTCTTITTYFTKEIRERRRIGRLIQGALNYHIHKPLITFHTVPAMSTTPRSHPLMGSVPVSPRQLASVRSPRAPHAAGGFKAATLLSTQRHTPSNRERLLGYHNDLAALGKLEAERRGLAPQPQTARPMAIAPPRLPTTPSSARPAPSTRHGPSALLASKSASEGLPLPTRANDDARTGAEPSDAAPDPSLETSPSPNRRNPFPTGEPLSEYEEIRQRIAAYEARYQRGQLQRRLTTIMRPTDGDVAALGQGGRGAGLASSGSSSDALQKAFASLKFSFLESSSASAQRHEDAAATEAAATKASEAERAAKEQRQRAEVDAAVQADRLRRFFLPKYEQAVRHHIGESRDEATRPRWMTDATGALVQGHNSNSINTEEAGANTCVRGDFHAFGSSTAPRELLDGAASSRGGYQLPHGLGGDADADSDAVRGEREGGGAARAPKHKRSVNELIRWLVASAEQRIGAAPKTAEASAAVSTSAGSHLFRCFELCCELCNFVLCKVLPPTVFAGDAESYGRLVAAARAALEEAEAAEVGEEAPLLSDSPPPPSTVTRAGATSAPSPSPEDVRDGQPDDASACGTFITRVPQPPQPSAALTVRGPSGISAGDVERRPMARLRAERALTGVAKARLQELMPTQGMAMGSAAAGADTLEALGLGPSDAGGETKGDAVVTKGKRHLSSIRQTLQAAADRHGLWLSLSSPRLAHPPLHACAHIEGTHLRDAQKYRRQVVALTGGQPMLPDGTETSAEARGRATADHVARNAVTDIEDFHKPDDAVLPIVELLQDMAEAMEGGAWGGGGGGTVGASRRPRAVGRQTGPVEGELLHGIADSYCSFVKAIADPELRAIKPPSVPTTGAAAGTSGSSGPIPTPKCAFAKRNIIVAAAPRLIIDATMAYLRTLVSPPTEASAKAERRHRKLLEYTITGDFRSRPLGPQTAVSEAAEAAEASADAALEAEVNGVREGSPSPASAKEAALRMLQIAASEAATSQQEKERMALLGREQDTQLRAEVMLRLRGELLYLFTGVDERPQMVEEHHRRERQRWEGLDARRRQRQQQQYKGLSGAIGASAGSGSMGPSMDSGVGRRSSPSLSPRHSPARGGGLAAPSLGESCRERSPAPSHLSFGGRSKSSRGFGGSTVRGGDDAAAGSGSGSGSHFPQAMGHSSVRRRSSVGGATTGGASAGLADASSLPLAPVGSGGSTRVGGGGGGGHYGHSIANMMDDLRREDEEAVASMMLLSARCGGVSVAGVTELTLQAQMRQHKRHTDARRSRTSLQQRRSAAEGAEGAGGGGRASGYGSQQLTSSQSVNGRAVGGMGSATSVAEGGGVRIIVDDASAVADIDSIEAPAVFPLPPKAAVFDWQSSHTAVPIGGRETAHRGTRPEVNPSAAFLRPTVSSSHSHAGGLVPTAPPPQGSVIKQLRFAVPDSPPSSAGGVGGGQGKATPTSAGVSPSAARRGRSHSVAEGHVPAPPSANAKARDAAPTAFAPITRRDEAREMAALAAEMLRLERHRRRHNPTIGLRNASDLLERERAMERERAAMGGEDATALVYGAADGVAAMGPLERANNLCAEGDDDEALAAAMDAANTSDGDGSDGGGGSARAPPPPMRRTFERGLAPSDIEGVRSFMAMNAKDMLGGGDGAVRRGGSSAKDKQAAKAMARMHAELSPAAAGALSEEAISPRLNQKKASALPPLDQDGAGPIRGHYQYHSSDGHYYFPLDTGAVRTNPKTGEQSRVVKLVSVTQSIVGAKEAAAVERFKVACRQTLPGPDAMRRWYEHKSGEGAFRKYRDERKDTITIEAERHLTNAAQPSGSTNTLQRGTFDVYGTSPLTVLWAIANDPRQTAGVHRKGKPLSINWTF